MMPSQDQSAEPKTIRSTSMERFESELAEFLVMVDATDHVNVSDYVRVEMDTFLAQKQEFLHSIATLDAKAVRENSKLISAQEERISILITEFRESTKTTHLTVLPVKQNYFSTRWSDILELLRLGVDPSLWKLSRLEKPTELLFSLYPKHIRARFSSEMTSVYLDMYRDAYKKGGIRHLTFIFVKSVVLMVGDALRERIVAVWVKLFKPRKNVLEKL